MLASSSQRIMETFREGGAERPALRRNTLPEDRPRFLVMPESDYTSSAVFALWALQTTTKCHMMLVQYCY
jgi:hypothetical protein